jgi:hypothetical protein
MKTSKLDTSLLDKLLELSEAIQSGDYSKRVVTGSGNDIISQIVNNFNKHADSLLITSLENNNNKRFDFELFINTISSYATHNFANKLPVSKNNTILDAIATGINVLGDELEQSVASKAALEIERNRLNQAQNIGKMGSWEYNLITKKLSGSDELYRIYELEPTTSEILAIVFEKKYHPEDLENLKTEINLAVVV